MALFKIFRGPSERLKGIKPTEGYAYFTPDDGKFYIDIANSEEAIVGKSSMTGANRICINSGLKDVLVLNCGTATTVINESTTIPSEPTLVPHFTCGDSSSTITSQTIAMECGDSNIQQITENTVLYNCGDSRAI